MTTSINPTAISNLVRPCIAVMRPSRPAGLSSGVGSVIVAVLASVRRGQALSAGRTKKRRTMYPSTCVMATTLTHQSITWTR